MGPSPSEAKSLREAKGLTVRELAGVFRLRDPGGWIVQAWEAGTRPIPGPIGLCYRMLRRGHLDEDVRQYRDSKVKMQRSARKGPVWTGSTA